MMWSDKSKADVLRDMGSLQVLAAGIEAQLRFGDLSPDAVLERLEDLRKYIDQAECAAAWDRFPVDEVD